MNTGGIKEVPRLSAVHVSAIGRHHQRCRPCRNLRRLLVASSLQCQRDISEEVTPRLKETS